MRLLILIPTQGRGGAEEYAVTLAKSAVSRGGQVHVSFPKTTSTLALIDDFDRLGVKYIPAKFAPKSADGQSSILQTSFQLLWTLLLLLRLRPTSVLIPIPWPDRGFASIIACASLKIRTTVVFQLCPIPLVFGPRILRLYQWAKSRNQTWVSVSKNNREILCNTFKLPTAEVRVIYNGTDGVPSAGTSNPALGGEIRQSIRNELRLPPDSRIALTVGRLNQQKGYDLLLREIPKIMLDNKSLYFVWIGEGEEELSLKELARRYNVADRVIMTGRRRDVERFLLQSDLFIFPTRYEGHPFALMEAMAYGLPVVASNASGIPELVENRHNGLLFRSESPQSLYETVSEALSNPTLMAKLAANAKLAIPRFSKESMTNQTLATFHWHKSTTTNNAEDPILHQSPKT